MPVLGTAHVIFIATKVVATYRGWFISPTTLYFFYIFTGFKHRSLFFLV